MEPLIAITLQVAPMVIAAVLLAGIDRRAFKAKWLIAAIALVYFNDALLTRLYGQFPDLLGGEWNWTGKLLALAGTLAIAALPAFGYARSGLTLRQKPGAAAGWIVSGVLTALFLALAIYFGDGRPDDAETIAFQWTMPGLEEELFYRGVLLLCLNEAFTARRRLLGADVGWAALLTSLLFGAIHGIGYDDGGATFEGSAFATTFISALILVWIRERTGSVLAPVLAHNAGNGLFTLF